MPTTFSTEFEVRNPRADTAFQGSSDVQDKGSWYCYFQHYPRNSRRSYENAEVSEIILHNWVQEIKAATVSGPCLGTIDQSGGYTATTLSVDLSNDARSLLGFRSQDSIDADFESFSDLPNAPVHEYRVVGMRIDWEELKKLKKLMGRA